jgi:hypothetical protein
MLSRAKCQQRLCTTPCSALAVKRACLTLLAQFAYGPAHDIGRMFPDPMLFSAVYN